MLNIEINFVRGRFHATPWGRHVNEGAIEWPPSPWRILRALVATWHLKCEDDQSESQTIIHLINSLSRTLPSFHLPPAITSHTRHYIPVNLSGNEKKIKIFDSFVHVDKPVVMSWNCSLEPQERDLVDHICRHTVYLGRGESICEMRVIADSSIDLYNSIPLDRDIQLSDQSQIVEVLCPRMPDEYQEWQQNKAIERRESEKAARSRKSGRIKELPSTLFEALHADTGDLRKDGWPRPPGSRFVNYTSPVRNLAPPVQHAMTAAGIVSTTARFAVSSSVPPRIRQTINLADRIHQALLSRYSSTRPDSVFSGRDEQGDPMKGHRHCHIFCEANHASDDRITHVTLHAPMGFDESACRTISSLRKVWGHGGHDVHLVLLGIGTPYLFPDCRFLSRSCTDWVSLTPFASTRHPKTNRKGIPKLDSRNRWIGSSKHDLVRLLLESGFPEPRDIVQLDHVEAGQRKIRALEFQLERKRAFGNKAHQIPISYRITFPEPVSGPIAVGHVSHFGMGLFRPIQSLQGS